jgi:phenylpropionate dioxygenase-like ring-hydroxylating dioxygenase large terminal subunit
VGLSQFWYAVEHSNAVDTSPVPVKLLDKRYILYRDSSGQVHALADQCPHRGASFAKGWVENDCLRCPYHGWSFRSDGHCNRIPADLPNTPIPAKARLQVFPVHEQSGFIWLFPGTPEAADVSLIPDFPELNQPGWRSVQGEYLWDAHFSRVVEAGLDTSHAPFVHKPFFPNRDDAAVDAYQVSTSGTSVEALVSMKPPERVGLLKFLIKRDRPYSSSTLTSYLPNINRIAIDFNWRGFQYIYFASNIPVSDTVTLTKWIGVRNFFPQRWADWNSVKNTVDTYLEDKDVVETQPQTPSWQAFGDELLLASDHLILAYRKAMASRAATPAQQSQELPA